ncbi:hypothetical protein HELRODRAFT_191254 [Helobdella robusta]|uniref:Uncharacterized protein n=1 Tax=Helobdella robusta TaxID=6412 RepID=T1FST0_HELRO|nr:hypothetical protein HELRODRAFT_191254 [Helobdella robusta]ESO06949.1 hypothetical protein HELRODRAFT_191254 [Helobdella robusta]
MSNLASIKMNFKLILSTLLLLSITSQCSAAVNFDGDFDVTSDSKDVTSSLDSDDRDIPVLQDGGDGSDDDDDDESGIEQIRKNLGPIRFNRSSKVRKFRGDLGKRSKTGESQILTQRRKMAAEKSKKAGFKSSVHQNYRGDLGKRSDYFQGPNF